MATVARFETASEPSTLVEPGTDRAASEATRYLAAGAYLDRKFRDRALEAVEGEPYRAFGPNYGCDIRVVLGHCLRARRIERVRDAFLTIILLMLLLTPGFLADLAYVLSNLEFIDYNLAWLLETHAGMLWLVFGLAVGVVAVELALVRFRILGGEVAKAEFERHAENGPKAGDVLPKELAEGRAHNVVVYGSFTPFVGAGITIGGWSFATRTDKGREDVKGAPETPQAFVLADLYRRVADEISDLGFANLRVEPRVYVDGRTIRSDRRFLPAVVARPTHHMEPSALERLRDESGGAARYYLCIEAVDWSGEIVLTLFLRLQQLRKSLFVEANYALLAPFQKPFYRIDEEDFEPRLGALGELFVKAGLLTLWRLPTAPLRTASLLWQPIGDVLNERARAKAIRHNPGYNYGAAKSLRELAADQRYRVYFQRLDEEMHVKIIEKQLLDALVDFLDEHDIDTSGLRERETTILNNGVMISGGSLQAEVLAVGEKAQAGDNRLKRGSKATQSKKAA